MSDRMLEILSAIIMILVIFAILLALVDWLKPLLNLAKDIGEAIVVIGGCAISGVGIGMRRQIRDHYLYDEEHW